MGYKTMNVVSDGMAGVMLRVRWLSRRTMLTSSSERPYGDGEPV